MKDFLEYLLQNIVDNPDKIRVEENPLDADNVSFQLTVDPTDMGKVIGKGGKIIKAIRDLAKVLAVKNNQRITVVLVEG